MNNEFEEIFEQMKVHGLKVPNNKIIIRIPNAKIVLENALRYFLGLDGKKMIWLPQYDQIAEWLEDNKGRGLLLYGSCGLGKTFLSRYVIPAIILKYHNKVVHSFDMTELNKEPDKVLAKHLIAIDDIGTEDISIRFGEKRSVVPEILDAAEKYGKLLLLTSNLGGEDLIKKYGNRTFDRILAVTKRIEFNGKSFRE
ncbi:MAG: hypothetical protein PHR62_04905 [Paludibacter sp.]|nr:hypothetical protein [Paludibacter sp.]